jgi:DNA repair exonuclease SbcCD ATPase subunit
MRIFRLRLSNYRGIEKADISFHTKGITVIEGPNEAGKTSLAEAIGILFEYVDSTKHRSVEAIKPVHRDAGSEIELHAETGPYVFTYTKRFHKRPETLLTITKPRTENLTGREAHERADAILRETIDVDLWRALHVLQGAEIRQVDFSRQTSLSAALDKAAGGHSADPNEESLFEVVKDEYGLYFTERGLEKKELQEARKQVEDAQTALSHTQQQLTDLEGDIDRVARLQIELAGLDKQEQELQKTVIEHEKVLQQISTLETELETARLKFESQRKSQEAAECDKKARQDLIAALHNAQQESVTLVDANASADKTSQNAQDNLTKAELAARDNENRRKTAEATLNLCRADFDYLNDKLHLEQMKERKERIDQARDQAALAQELLKTNHVDDDQLNKIQELERALDIAKAQLTAGAPSLNLKALTSLNFQIDDVPEQLDTNETTTLPVSDRVRVTIPNIIDIHVTAGASAADLARTVEKAKDILVRVCNSVAIANPDEARTAHRARREALRQIEYKDQIEHDNLRDLSYHQLESKIASLSKTIPAYLLQRPSEPPLLLDLESLRSTLREAEHSVARAASQWEAARTDVETARKVRDQLRLKHQELRVQLDLKTTDIKRAEDNLLSARTQVSDDALETNLKKACAETQFWQDKVRSAEDTLTKKGPDRVKTMAQTAKGSLETIHDKSKDIQQDLTEVRARLNVFGEDGLHEKLQVAKTRAEHLHQEHVAMRRRATAAKLLFETLREERDKARRAYVAPLQHRIEQLGRLLFNDTFQVEVTNDLRIATRTLNGITVPFDSLSGGTKEQLCLIVRLACAIIVAKSGGAPLILDDTLGYTDPERLKFMGTLLAKAGQECQIIILTCVPDRYSNIGAASIVRLG